MTGKLAESTIENWLPFKLMAEISTGESVLFTSLTVIDEVWPMVMLPNCADVGVTMKTPVPEFITTFPPHPARTVITLNDNTPTSVRGLFRLCLQRTMARLKQSRNGMRREESKRLKTLSLRSHARLGGNSRRRVTEEQSKVGYFLSRKEAYRQKSPCRSVKCE